jgi:hypothetical protein
MAELRPYEPTWRDRLANVLMGDGRSSARQQFVEGLLGSRGLGQTGMGLVDVTPFGIPLAVQESRQSFDQGSPVSGLLGAMAVLPAAKPAALAAKAATQEAARGIRAYHGSPYDFERFDPSKIGTGEGKQVFGRGFNFSENEKVAQKYRDQLSSGTYKTGSGDVLDPSMLGHMNVRNAGYKSIDDAIERAFMLLQTQPENKDLITRDLNRLIAAKEAGAVPNKGSMYEVNINAKPEQFLDWNKPVAEQKGFLDLLNPDPNVQRAILDKVLGSQKGSGEEYYKALGGERNSQNVAQSLSQRGVPGIKYLGQASEEAGDASKNYVIFDSKIIDLLRKYGIVGTAGGAAASGGGILADEKQKDYGAIL